MSTVYLGWPNRLSDQGVSVSGGSWLSDLPLSNLLDRTPTIIARSADLLAASTKFDVSFPVSRSMRAFALVNHNLTQSATWRLKIGSTIGASDIYDSGDLPVWHLDFDNGLMEWESENWWEGSYDDDFIGHPFSAIHVAPTELSGKFLRVEISDSSNPAGHVQIGRLFAGGGISPGYGISVGMSEQWEDASIAESAIGGSEYFDERRRFRTTRFELPWIDQTSEFRQFYEMQRRLGTTGEVLFIPNIGDLVECQLSGFVGRMRKLNAIEYPYYRSRKSAFELKELL